MLNLSITQSTGSISNLSQITDKYLVTFEIFNADGSRFGDDGFVVGTGYSNLKSAREQVASLASTWNAKVIASTLYNGFSLENVPAAFVEAQSKRYGAMTWISKTESGRYIRVTLCNTKASRNLKMLIFNVGFGGFKTAADGLIYVDLPLVA